MRKKNNANRGKTSRKRSPYKGEKSYPNPCDSEKREDFGSTNRLSPLNDFSWYNKYPELLEAAARVPFPYKPGMTLNVAELYNPVASTAGQVAKTANMRYEIPGVSVLLWYPSIGNSFNATDPASIVGKEIYAKVRSAFSGSLDADAPDYVIYMLCLDSIFSYISSLKRVYRLLVAYSPNNYITPDRILRSLGFTSEAINSLKTERTQFWQYINELIHMLNKFRCPAIFDYFNRHYWMNDNVYTDAATPNSQFYLFRQLGYFTFGLTGEDVKVGSCIMTGDPVLQANAVVTAGNGGAAAALFSYGQAMIQALADSDDGYLISGYLTRAYEGTPNFSIDLLRADEEFVPVYVEEVLSQIENSYGPLIGMYNDSTSTVTGLPLSQLNVTQDPATNSVLSNPQFNWTGRRTPYSPSIMPFTIKMAPTLSIRKDAVTIQDVVVASRLKTCVDQQVITTNNSAAPEVTEITANFVFGSEFVVGWQTSNPMGYTDGSMQAVNQSICITTNGPLDTGVSNALRICAQFSASDWAPFIWLGINTASNRTFQINLYPFGDTHNFTSLDVFTFKEIERVCLYSEFNAFA